MTKPTGGLFFLFYFIFWLYFPDRGSHRFSRTLVDYDESMSMMSFRSRSFRRLSNTNENTLYESVISFIQGDPSDNEYCREKILEICGQADIVSFEERYPNG